MFIDPLRTPRRSTGPVVASRRPALMLRGITERACMPSAKAAFVAAIVKARPRGSVPRSRFAAANSRVARGARGAAASAFA